jgi:hypothetical protein
MPIRKLLTGLIGFTAAAAVFAALAACSPSPEPKHVSVREFAAVASWLQVVVVDVRTPQEFAVCLLAPFAGRPVRGKEFRADLAW